MPRKPRIESAGFHHIVNRGVARSKVFFEDRDKEEFLKYLCEGCEFYGARVHAYSLMDNHYHLLLETTQENLSLLMRLINSRYAAYFNKKYNRVGHLWQGRFKSWYVLSETYLYTLIRYIEQNPIKAGMVGEMSAYRFGGYRAFIGLDEPIHCLRESIVFRDFTDREEVAGLFETILTEEMADTLFEEIAKETKEISSGVQAVEKSEKKDLEAIGRCSDREERKRLIYQAYREGHSQSKIARYLGVSQAYVSKIVRGVRKDEEE